MWRAAHVAIGRLPVDMRADKLLSSPIATVPPLRRLVSWQTSALLALAAAAWTVTALQARDMGVMSGTMGLGLAAFIGMWAPMMAAMMLPAVTPVALLYARLVHGVHTSLRLTSFACGYLLVWAATALPAYGLLLLVDRLTDRHETAATATAAAAFALCGLYQLSPLKRRCLAHCRSPLALLMHYGSYRGPLRDLRVGLHHGAYCAGCCWALFLLLIVVGVMNVAAMLALVAVVLLEKLWSHGELLSRAVGVAALGLAVAVVFAPGLRPGLSGGSSIDGTPAMQMDGTERPAVGAMP
jgi:predicted metal-binding membrane protein